MSRTTIRVPPTLWQDGRGDADTLGVVAEGLVEIREFPDRPIDQVGFAVAAGQICTLQVSPDLVDWSDVFSITNINNTSLSTNYTAAIGSAPTQEFFRLRLP